MPNDVLQEAIKEAYASCPSDVFIYHTLEIKHPDFVDDDGNPTTIRLVQGFKNITAKLENGEKVEFSQCALIWNCHRWILRQCLKSQWKLTMSAGKLSSI